MSCDLYEKVWKAKLKNIEESDKSKLKDIICRYDELNSIVYSFFWLRESRDKKPFFDPIVAIFDGEPHLIGDTDLISLQNSFKFGIKKFEEKAPSLESVILPLTKKAYKAIDDSIICGEGLPDEYGYSLFSFDKSKKDNQYHLIYSNFDYLTKLVLDVNFEIVERPFLIPAFIKYPHTKKTVNR